MPTSNLAYFNPDFLSYKILYRENEIVDLRNNLLPIPSIEYNFVDPC